MKWLRKNNRKIMIVVIFIAIIGFVGGSYLSNLKYRRDQGLHDTVAYFGDSQEITRLDLLSARQELEILKMLQVEILLRSIPLAVFGGLDLHPALLAELLFSERTNSSASVNYLKGIVRRNRYSISDKQLDDIYKGPMPAHVYWYLLKNEAKQAGIGTSTKAAAELLGRIIPQVSRRTYKQTIKAIVDRNGVPEEKILATFAELLSIFEYSKIVSSSENMTISQIKHNLSWEKETMDVEFIYFDSAIFAHEQPEPLRQQLVEHFERYKSVFAGTVSDDNPYGFGYKPPDRVRLEYITVKIDDISKIITPPTQQETEDYYQQYAASKFTPQVSLDPNDPNSPTVEQRISYAEVESEIFGQLLKDKINLEAERILQDAMILTDLNPTDTEPNLTVEQLSRMAGSYESAGNQLAEKYKIPVYTGKTGLLTATDIRADEQLRTLYLGNPEQGNIMELAKIVFAIEQLASSKTGWYDVAKPRMYENMGLLKDAQEQILTIVRVIETQKASVPESIDQTFSKETLVLDESDKDTDDTYSVKELVTEDLKKLSAMETTREKLKQFKIQIVEDGWGEAINKFNKQYIQETDDVKEIELRGLASISRMSPMMFKIMELQVAGDPEKQLSINMTKKNSLLRDLFYSLVSEDKDTLESVPAILEFKPEMSYYFIKSLFVKRFDLEQYEELKGQQSYKENVVSTQSLAPVHFNPENILERLKFKLAENE